MSFYGNITNTSRTQFQFDLTYPSRYKMTQQCSKDGVYIGRYVLVDYDSDPNNVVKDGFRKGKLSDFKDGSPLYLASDLADANKITYYLNDYWDYEWATTDVINGVIQGTIVRVKETLNQYKEYDESGNPIGSPVIEAGQYSFYECIGKENETYKFIDPVDGKEKEAVKQIALFKWISEVRVGDRYNKNYEEDRMAYGDTIGRGWDSTVWQKVYENGKESYVMIAELNGVVPTFDIQADAPSMSPLIPHFDEASTNVYYKLHWQPQWGMRTRAAAGDLKTYPLDKNGKIIPTQDKHYTSSSVDLAKGPAENYPSDASTKWEKYEYDVEEGNQLKYQYNINDQLWEVPKEGQENDEKYQIPAAIYWNEAGFNDEKIFNTKAEKEIIENEEWDGTTDFISIKPTGWSGHQYSSHDGFKQLKPAVDTQELMVMLPSIGNTISEVWDLVYGGVDTNDTIKNTKKRNKNIDWEDPTNQLHRKGLRLINDRYEPITLTSDEFEPNTYYWWNEEIYDYELADKLIEGVTQYYTRSGGQTFDKAQITTLAGCINSVHDLMGMIIVDKEVDDDPNNAPLESLSSDYIYYYPKDGTYRIKGEEYIFTDLTEDNFTYETVELTESDFAPFMFYTKDGDTYIPVPENATYVEGTQYYVKKLRVDSNALFEKVNLDSFMSGYYNTSTGSYIFKQDGTPDDGIIYYDINHNKIVGDSSVWPREFEHNYEKNVFYTYTENKTAFELLQTEICDRTKKPFYHISQEINKDQYPYTIPIKNIASYDKTKENVPEDATQAAIWKGPYLSAEGYWSEKDEKWVENEYAMPTYFFTLGTYWIPIGQNDNPEYEGEEDYLGGIQFKQVNFIPADGIAYILDRPRANTNMPDEDPVYGNAVAAYKVKLIDYDALDKEVKNRLYYAETEKYEIEVEKEDGTKELVEKTRFLKWKRITKDDIDNWYYRLGYRQGGKNSIEPDLLMPKETIYFMRPTSYSGKQKIDYLYEPNRYYYLGTDEISYIKDRNLKFTEGTKYFDGDNFRINKTDEQIKNKTYAITPQGSSGKYYLPNKYYIYDETQGKYILDISQEPREDINYYEKNDIYVSNDDSNTFKKGSIWNLNASTIPSTVTLSKRSIQPQMRELKGFGRNFNTINGLIVEMNKLLSGGNYDSRDKSTLQGAINYLNDIILKFEALTPGDFPIVDYFGRLHGGRAVTDEWIDVKFDPNTDDPKMIVTHEHNPVNKDNTSEDVNGNGDTFTYPTYTFDKMGHQVGEAEHTVTLPYSFKTIKATNTGDNAVNAPEIKIKGQGQIADNTQDTLTFSASNRWVKFDNNTEDTIKVGHLLSPFIDETTPNKLYGLTQNEDYTKAVNDLGDLDKDNTFEVPCFQFDEAGHILEARTHTVTIPENFTKHVNTLSDAINVDNTVGTVGEINPDTLTDTLTFAEGNRWINIAADANNDKFTFSHYVKNFNETTSTLDFNNTDNGKTFTVQSIGWDRAGHLISSDKKTFTLPDNFKVVEVSEQSTSTENSLNGQKGTIIADNLVDTLTLKSGNKWIQLFGNADDDSVTFKHYVNKFTETTAKTDNNVLANNEISTQELTWDEAGHLISSNKHTYTLPNNFKTFTVSNDDGKDNVNSATAADGSLVAGNQIDEITFASGNRWMTLIADADSKKVTLAHAKAGAASISKGDTESQTPKFGSTFKALSAGIDQTGHVSSLKEHTVQIPLPSLNNGTVGGVDSVLTKLSLEPIDGAFTTECKNVGELLITGYSVATENNAVSATDSINSAFGKVQKALDTLNADSETAGSIAKSVKELKNELQDNCSERFNTLAKIESDINDGSETTLVERVQDLEKRALPHYDELEDEGVYLMKMIDGQPNWIKLATWTGGTY